MSEDAISLVDLEGRLRGDDDGSIRDELVAEFQTQAGSIKRHMDGGLSPDDFEQAQLLHSAFEAAESVVTTYWDMAHAAGSAE